MNNVEKMNAGALEKKTLKFKVDPFLEDFLSISLPLPLPLPDARK